MHLGRHHLRARREMGEEFLGLLAYAAADDDQVRPEEELDLVEILVESPGVLFPAQVIALAGAVRGSVLGVLALTSMCPNSVLGTSLPPTSELPMPVPSVSIRTTPS